MTIRDIEFTELEPRKIAQSLSFVSLNENHVRYGHLSHMPTRWDLPYPGNYVLALNYDLMLQGLTGFIQMEDATTNHKMQRGKINSLSIEYLSGGGVDGKGIVDTELALVTSNVKAADKRLASTCE